VVQASKRNLSRECEFGPQQACVVDALGEENGRGPNCALVRVEFWCALRRHSKSYGDLQLSQLGTIAIGSPVLARGFALRKLMQMPRTVSHSWQCRQCLGPSRPHTSRCSGHVRRSINRTTDVACHGPPRGVRIALIVAPCVLTQIGNHLVAQAMPQREGCLSRIAWGRDVDHRLQVKSGVCVRSWRRGPCLSIVT
jgi:hypothetical protein